VCATTKSRAQPHTAVHRPHGATPTRDLPPSPWRGGGRGGGARGGRGTPAPTSRGVPGASAAARAPGDRGDSGADSGDVGGEVGGGGGATLGGLGGLHGAASRSRGLVFRGWARGGEVTTWHSPRSHTGCMEQLVTGPACDTLEVLKTVGQGGGTSALAGALRGAANYVDCAASTGLIPPPHTHCAYTPCGPHSRLSSTYSHNHTHVYTHTHYHHPVICPPPPATTTTPPPHLCPSKLHVLHLGSTSARGCQ
jgi:hypothetical protein